MLIVFMYDGMATWLKRQGKAKHACDISPSKDGCYNELVHRQNQRKQCNHCQSSKKDKGQKPKYEHVSSEDAVFTQCGSLSSALAQSSFVPGHCDLSKDIHLSHCFVGSHHQEMTPIEKGIVLGWKFYEKEIL